LGRHPVRVEPRPVPRDRDRSKRRNAPASRPDVARCVAPGDWVGLARTLADELSTDAAPDERLRERAARFSMTAAAERLATAYDELLAGA
jgi:hypothetical protein